jgi:hypothetical protein
MREKMYYQYYTNVTYLTCPDCLAWHGRIAEDPESFPDREDGCERRLLAFDKRKLDYHREQERRMRAAVEAELERRDLLVQAKEALGKENGQALALFAQASEIDVHVPELAALCAEKEGILKADLSLRERLRTLFARAYSDKFGHPRYERLPEAMRLARERAGVERIKELFA